MRYCLVFSGAIRDLCEPKKSISSNVRIGKLKETASSFLGLSASVIQHPHLLLQFFDSLEKLLYNAYEGCAVSIPPPSKVSSESLESARSLIGCSLHAGCAEFLLHEQKNMRAVAELPATGCYEAVTLLWTSCIDATARTSHIERHESEGQHSSKFLPYP